MDFNKLRTFISLLQTGSYTETANRLHISQPTVSSHIKSLEDEFSTSLVRKRGNRYEPTENGAILYHYASQILDLEDSIYRQLAKRGDLGLANLKIATTDKGTYILPEISKDFVRIYPNIQLFFSISNTASCLDLYFNDVIDACVIPFTKEIRSIPPENIFELGQDELALAVSRNHPLLDQEPIQAQDLSPYKCIIREDGSNTRSLSLQWMMEHDIQPASRYEMSNSETIVKAVEKNVGLSLLPQNISSFIPTQLAFIDQLPGLPIKRKYVLISKQAQSEVIQDFAYLAKKAFNRVDDLE